MAYTAIIHAWNTIHLIPQQELISRYLGVNKSQLIVDFAEIVHVENSKSVVSVPILTWPCHHSKEAVNSAEIIDENWFSFLAAITKSHLFLILNKLSMLYIFYLACKPQISNFLTVSQQ